MIGAIADDFTGATDLAGNFAQRGFRTVTILDTEVESGLDLSEFDAIVVATKSRALPPHEAKAEAAKAFSFLSQFNPTQIYDKYCSTFDSTEDGNIGPIAEELAQLTKADRAIVVPSFPDAGRSTYQGYLFVNGQLLEESGMKDHPLNPMTDSSIPRLLARQSNSRIEVIPLERVREGAIKLREYADALTNSFCFIVIDAISNHDLEIIAKAFKNDALITGGSGIALGMSCNSPAPANFPVRHGRRAIIAGSASTKTQAQVNKARKQVPSLKLDLDGLRSEAENYLIEVSEWFNQQWTTNPQATPLIYSVGEKNDVSPKKDSSDLIENFYADLSASLANDGCSQMIIAGGETSGAVVKALGLNSLELGPSLGPGVSWLYGCSDTAEMNIVLKSGNFGDEDLFLKGWKELDQLV